MPQQRLLLTTGPEVLPFTPRRLVSILFRRRRLICISFCAVFLLLLLVVFGQPPEYASQMLILVQRRRSDPMITAGLPGSESLDSMVVAQLDEQALDTEMDLLQSEDVLRQAVIACDLWSHVSRLRSLLHLPLPSKEVQISRAMERLRRDLKIAPPKPPNKSDVITLEYRSDDPQKSAQVLQAISNAYLEKHLQVHRPAGASDFFNDEVERNRRTLQDAEARLVEFTKATGVVAADVESATLLQKIAEFDASLQSTNAQIKSNDESIRNLEAQLRAVSPRVTTKVRSSPDLLENLKETLHALELQRSDLLAKYQPSYRPVTDLDKQIAETRAAIRSAEAAPTEEVTTEQAPVYVWLSSELAKAREEQVAFRASASRTQQTLADYRAKAIRLEELGKEQDQLTRAAKSAEDTYTGSLRKQSEARTAEALDRAQIMNVAVAQSPTVPALPVLSRTTKLIFGFPLAVMVALGMAIIFESLDQTFHAPYELEAHLDLPVLAAVPRSREPIAAISKAKLPPRLEA